MLAPSCRTRRAMRPAEIIGFGCVSPGAPTGRRSAFTCGSSLVRQGRDGRAGRCGAAVQAVMTAERAVKIEGHAAEVGLRPRAAVWVVAEDHPAAAGQLEPAFQAL